MVEASAKIDDCEGTVFAPIEAERRELLSLVFAGTPVMAICESAGGAIAAGLWVGKRMKPTESIAAVAKIRKPVINFLTSIIYLYYNVLHFIRYIKVIPIETLLQCPQCLQWSNFEALRLVDG